MDAAKLANERSRCTSSFSTPSAPSSSAPIGRNETNVPGDCAHLPRTALNAPTHPTASTALTGVNVAGWRLDHSKLLKNWYGCACWAGSRELGWPWGPVGGTARCCLAAITNSGWRVQLLGHAAQRPQSLHQQAHYPRPPLCTWESQSHISCL